MLKKLRPEERRAVLALSLPNEPLLKLLQDLQSLSRHPFLQALKQPPKDR